MSAAIGPCSDSRLPKEEQEQEKDQLHPQTSIAKNNPKPRTRRGFLTFRQFNALAVMIVFAASGLARIEDFALVVFSIIYMHFIAKVAFPPHSPVMQRVFDPNHKLMRFYFLLTAIVGLFLPIAYICEGIIDGDKEGIKAAAPHVFLLVSQVLMEGWAFSDRFSLPIQVFVPVFYNSRRIFTIVEWLRTELAKVDEGYGGSVRRLHVGRALAVANLVLWCYNLFGFLLPVFLPRAFKKYYASGYKVKD